MAGKTSNAQAEADIDAGEAGGGVGVARKRVLTFLKRHDQLVGKFLPKLLEAMTPVPPPGLCVRVWRGGGQSSRSRGGLFAGRPEEQQGSPEAAEQLRCGGRGAIVRGSGSEVGVHEKEDEAPLCAGRETLSLTAFTRFFWLESC